MAKEKNKTELPTVMEGELKARLIKLREEAGYDIPQMARALCLSEETIVNLENEAFELLAEPPYVRGYLRNYAKLGEEDPLELINRYESLRGAEASELDYQIKSSSTIRTTPVKRISPIWGQVILLGFLIGGIGLIATIPGVKAWIENTWSSFSSKLQPSDASNNPSLLGELPVPVPFPEDEVAISTQEANPTNTAVESIPASTEQTNSSTENTSTAENLSAELSSSATPNTSTTTPDSTSLNTEQVSTTEAETAATNETTTSETVVEETVVPNTGQLINIQLAFNKEVWLRIKDKDNKTVFEGLNKAGTDKTLSLEKPLTFRVGNAQGLSMLIDEKAVDISTYINGSIANFTLE